MYDASLESKERFHASKETKQELANSQTNNKHFKSLRRKTQTPKIKNKRDYLTKINVDDCIKDKVIGIYTVSTRNTLKQEKVQQNKTLKRKNKTKKEQMEGTQQANWSTH